MNFETSLTDNTSINTSVSNLETLKHSNSTSADYLANSSAAADFLSKSLPSSPSQNDGVNNNINLNSNVSKINTIPVMDSNHSFDSSLGLQSKAPTQDELLFRTRTISHSNHRPHPQALRELSAIVNSMGMGNSINENSGINNTIGLGNSMNGMNSLVNKAEPSEEFNLFNNRSFTNSNVPIGSNSNWPPLQWNNYLKPMNSGSNSTSFSLINKNINNNSSNNNTNIMINVNNPNTSIVNENSPVSSTTPSNEEKENVNNTNSVTTSTITTTVTSATSTTDLNSNISSSTTLTSTTSAVTTQDFNVSSTTTTTTTSTTSGLNIQSIFNPNSKPFSPIASENKTETSGLMHSDSNVTLINGHVINNTAVSANNILTSPNGITPQTPLINQFSKLSLESGGLAKSSPSSGIYNNIFFNESDQSSLFHGSPINNNLSTNQILRHNSLPLSSNTTMLISSERESDMSHLKNDIDLLIRSSQLKFDELIKYKGK